ncbi:ribonuclease P protein component [Mycoplasma sp. Pen4]|uniref:ribonuclease P protein component n=1 Tax=Mycoplasma sp. Pen4 TaxID=640330 RepID=UPI00165416A5|nr:ribonuclease P protein component [Mycoplasma sp. Pen4]QNM93655.1 ribonuclease P protein component [Mycoplasma sp. Pen4]
MKKQYRLKKNWEFDNVMNRGKGSHILNKFLIIYYKPAKQFKVGLTVPKKFAGAVGRNLYKRQLRAILNQIPLLDLKYELVLIVRKEFISSDFGTKSSEIKKLFEKFRKNEKI